MPIYEFQCQECNTRFEDLLSLAAAQKPRVCPCCGAVARRVISSFAVHVSGGRPAAGGKNCGSCSRSSCAGC